MTNSKKGFYYYFIRVMVFIYLPIAMMGLYALKGQYLNGTLLVEYNMTIKSLFMVACELYFINEIFKYGTGYTTISTSKYNLFRCRESGKEESFMMFADSEEELERFFEYSRPDKIVFIENAEMTGKSIEMKIFNQEYENRSNNS